MIYCGSMRNVTEKWFRLDLKDVSEMVLKLIILLKSSSIKCLTFQQGCDWEVIKP